MDLNQSVLALLVASLDASRPIRTDAERQLEQLYSNVEFPNSLLSVAAHKEVPLANRQAALLALKGYVLKTWSPSLDEFEGTEILTEAAKEQIRQAILAIATASDEDKKVVAVSSLVVSKIASVDFPEQWPSLLPSLLHAAPQADPTSLHGVLVVLSHLVEDGFDDEQFSTSAANLINCLFDVAVDIAKKSVTRALAVSVFRAGFDTMELVYQTNPAAVEQFMQEAADAWTPLFLEILKTPLPPTPAKKEDIEASPGGPEVIAWRGAIALHTQVAKALLKIHLMFPHLLAPRTMELFTATWEALQAHLNVYQQLFTGDDPVQCRLVDSDHLAYTLDFLVIEELDYLQTLLNTTTIKRELDAQLQSEGGAQGNAWITQLCALAAGYSYVLTEDAELWEVDINIYLSEETSETANYSARNACGALVAKLCSYGWPVLECLLGHTKSVFESEPPSAKAKEAALYIVKQALDEISSCDRAAGAEVASAYLNYVKLAIQDDDSELLRARGYIVAGALISTSGQELRDLAPDFAQQTLKAIEDDPSEMVKVSCLRVLQDYLKLLPSTKTGEFQVQTVAAISKFLATQDLTDLGDSEDMLDTLVETLRDAVMTDPILCLEHPALDVLFTLASAGASSLQVSMLVNEAFESIVLKTTSAGPDVYTQLCSKVLPSLTGALDIGNMTQENALSDIAVSLLAILAEHGSEPLPQGFVAAVLPKLYQLLFMEAEFSVHQSATVAIKYILIHDPAQVFEWRDPVTGKEGLEIVLLIVDRLLGPNVDDASAAEVGGLAVELVEKAGAEKLGPYLMQLLQVVAIRLSTAERANFVQNLVLVFARLSLTNAQEVLDFLAEVQVDGEKGGNGLEVVLRKWLENSVNFSGYHAIKQNVVALTNIYKLHDERLSHIQTKGDLVIQSGSRIKTRSQAKKEPDQYAIIPVPLKLTKVLIQELSVTSPTATTPGLSNGRFHRSASGSEEEEWEDEPTVLDLGAPSTRQELMGYMDESRWNTRQSDDETQKHLVDFFNNISSEPGFEELYNSLNNEEREKLHKMNDVNGQLPTPVSV